MTSSKSDYELTVEHRKGYVYARVRGNVSRPEITIDYLTDITDACRKVQCTKVVIEKEIPRAFAVWDIFFVATQFPRFTYELTKVAVVDKRMARFERREFSVVAGSKPGLDVHVFTNVQEAEAWVLAEKAGKDKRKKHR